MAGRSHRAERARKACDTILTAAAFSLVLAAVIGIGPFAGETRTAAREPGLAHQFATAEGQSRSIFAGL